MPKVILISQFPLPYSKYGSWTTMYNNYLSADHHLDYIVCERPDKEIVAVKYQIVQSNLMSRIRRRLLKFYRIGYVDALEKIIVANPNEKFVIQLIDNYKIVPWINQLLKRKGVRDNCYLQVFYHGFAPFINAHDYKDFYQSINELVLLTKDSYKSHTQFYSIFPCKVSILNNGVDISKFHKANVDKITELRAKHGITGKKVFLWCSQDRPKKGLDLILDAWKRIYPEHPNTILLVVGTKRTNAQDGVKFFGKIPNDDLPEYYQMSDCYLFPTLCHEGFGLSLIEALNCGCYCIASKAGGVPEVLHYGEYGRLVENPNFLSEWIDAITNYITGAEKPIYIDKPVYDFSDWVVNMNKIIDEAKKSLS